MRIDRFLANSGLGSRKDVKALLKSGQVVVDGEKITRPEYKIELGVSEVVVDSERIDYVKYVYLMMNKPQGVISATTDPYDEEETILDLLPEEYAYLGVYPVGRLDKDATGLILLTNDGIFAHRATSPKKDVKKVYYVEVAGELDETDITAFKSGVKLDDGYVCREAGLEIIESDVISRANVTLTEGKFHQVKRMFQARGKRVTLLRRVAFCGIVLPEDLPEGEARFLTEAEMEMISRLISND